MCRNKTFAAMVAAFLSFCIIGNATESGSFFSIPAPCDRTAKKKSKIDVYGWIMTGITVNDHGNKNEYGNGAPYGYNRQLTPQGGNSYVLMLEQPSDWKVNQLWVGMKKDLGETLDWGFRADFNYGTDSRYARNWGDQSFDYSWGTGDYYAAFAQLYATLGTKDLSVKVGKFAGSFAYEGLAATKEFFYSHANICYGRPLTTSGVVVDSNLNDRWTISAGWTAGVFNSFDNSYGDSAFLGKITYKLSKSTALTYKVFYNDKAGDFRNGVEGTDAFQTLILTHQISKAWFYMIEGAIVDSKTYTGTGKVGGDAWGINQHLIYTINKKWAVGLRGEFHHSHNSMFDQAAVTGGQGGDLYELTLAAHYKITPKAMFRPELRYDHADYDNGYHPFGGGTNNNVRHDDQLSGGVSFILEF
jgi:hypothetical protein